MQQIAKSAVNAATEPEPGVKVPELAPALTVIGPLNTTGAPSAVSVTFVFAGDPAITIPGVAVTTSDVRSFSALPAKARAYAKRIAELTGARLSIVSVGPSRAQTISV